MICHSHVQLFTLNRIQHVLYPKYIFCLLQDYNIPKIYFVKCICGIFPKNVLWLSWEMLKGIEARLWFCCWIKMRYCQPRRWICSDVVGCISFAKYLPTTYTFRLSWTHLSQLRIWLYHNWSSWIHENWECSISRWPLN